VNKGTHIIYGDKIIQILDIPPSGLFNTEWTVVNGKVTPIIKEGVTK
jgi:hypothetical protein